MPCNWISTAKHISQARFHPLISRSPWPQPLLPVHLVGARTVSHWLRTNKKPKNAIANPVSIPTLIAKPIRPPSETSLSAAQKSRAAARAVSHSISNGDIQDAFFVVNSLRYSQYLAPSHSPLHRIPGINRELESFGPSALNFGQAVSPRLTCHVAIHGLFRAGLHKEALQLAKHAMEDGILIRPDTLERLIHKLAPSQATPFHSLKAEALRKLQRFVGKAAPLSLKLAEGVDDGTKCAVDIIRASRSYGHQWMGSMFTMIMMSCLTKSNLVFGSLVFIAVAKEWAQQEAAPSVQDAVQQAPIPEKATVTPARASLAMLTLRETLFPSQAMLKKLLDTIEGALAQQNRGEEPSLLTQLAMQALSSLIRAVERRELPNSHMSAIVTVASRTSRVHAYGRMSAIRGDRPAMTNPNGFICLTLNRMCKTLVNGNTYDMATHNALLDHALHLKNMSFAEEILQYILDDSRPHLYPDEETLRILEEAWSTTRYSPRLRLMVEDLNPPWWKSKTELYLPSAVSCRINTFNMERPTLSQHEPDSRTLHAAIAYLVATGRPSVIKTLLGDLFPSFLKQEGEDSAAVNARAMQSVARASELGPEILTSIMNALSKNRRYGFGSLEVVWRVANEAQGMSWTTDKPWCLPIAAYTIMLNTYADQAAAPEHEMVVNWGNREYHGTSRKRHGIRRGLQVLQDFYHGAHRLASFTSPGGSQVPKMYPRPDARFFNALLKLVNNEKSGASKHATPSRYLRRLNVASKQYVTLGDSQKYWNPAFVRVMSKLSLNGHRIPPVYWQIMVGMRSTEKLRVGRQYPIERQPFGMRRILLKPNNRVRSLQTIKTRGAPIRRRRLPDVRARRNLRGQLGRWLHREAFDTPYMRKESPVPLRWRKAMDDSELGYKLPSGGWQ